MDGPVKPGHDGLSERRAHRFSHTLESRDAGAQSRAPLPQKG
jgi:hypothetical protein